MQTSYADGPFRYNGHIPYVADEATLISGWIKGSKPLQQAVLDLYLNRVEGAQFRFNALTGWMLFTYLDAARMRSGSPVDATKGSTPEKDLGLWILTHGGKIGDEANWKFRWFPTYIFVDDGAALVSGREVFGYPKHMARFTDTRDETQALTRLDLTARSLSRFHPDEVAQDMTIMSLLAGDDAGKKETTLDAAMRAFQDFLKDAVTFPIQSKALRSILLPNMDMSLVFLRQFPDVADTRRAHLKQLVYATNRTTSVSSVSLLTDKMTLKLLNPPVYPMDQVLGLKSENRVRLPMKVEFSFQALPGELAA